MTNELSDKDEPASTPNRGAQLEPVPDQVVAAEPDDIEHLLATLEKSMCEPLTQLTTADSMIDAAVRSNPDHADVLWHSLRLLRPTSPRMTTDFVYRAHVRELLDRVIAEQDPRPGTAAELCALLAEASQLAPLRTAAFGLYTRMWQQAFADTGLDHVMPDPAPYEAVAGSRIDDLESTARAAIGRQMTWRQLTGITCDGSHHGVEVTCRFRPPRSPDS